MMRAVKCLVPGGIETLSLMSIPIPVPATGEVLIKVHATALNRADLLQRRGLYPPPPGYTDVLGLECAGELITPTASLPQGSRVMGFLRGGGYAEYVSVHQGQILPIPASLSFTEAASICEAWLTAYKCLCYLGRAKAGERVLIHAGASGVGSALIPLAKWKGLTVFCTCGTAAKADFCRSLGADRVINYKTEDFGSIVEQAGGVDLIMDSVGAKHFEQNLKSIAKEGRWVVYGFLSGSKVKEVDLAKVFAKLVSLQFTSFRSRSDEFRNDVISEFIREGILEEFDKGRFRPQVYREITLEEVGVGHQIMENNENLGKIVVRVL
jgi:tumor protein p53-inducible protein 3